MKELITASPLFGLSITILTYAIGVAANRKTGKAIFNPLLISELMIIAVLLIFRIPFSAFNEGGAIINLFLGPVTAMLAYSIYRERRLVGKHLASIVVGTAAGSIASIATIMLLSRLLGLDETLSSSLTGVLGNILAPFMIKLFRVRNRVAQGVAIGTASHVVGTSKALELGEDIGAISGIALTFSGIITAIIAMLAL